MTADQFPRHPAVRSSSARRRRLLSRVLAVAATVAVTLGSSGAQAASPAKSEADVKGVIGNLITASPTVEMSVTRVIEPGTAEWSYSAKFADRSTGTSGGGAAGRGTGAPRGDATCSVRRDGVRVMGGCVSFAGTSFAVKLEESGNYTMKVGSRPYASWTFTRPLAKPKGLKKAECVISSVSVEAPGVAGAALRVVDNGKCKNGSWSVVFTSWGGGTLSSSSFGGPGGRPKLVKGLTAEMLPGKVTVSYDPTDFRIGTTRTVVVQK